MKRKNENVPGFDEIIFRDRNKEYGAYDLRRRYGSTMSISIAAGLIFGTSLILVPFFASDHTVRQPGSIIEVVAITDNTLLQPPELPAPPAPKPPPGPNAHGASPTKSDPPAVPPGCPWWPAFA